jgi:sigma-E processing peptidase SpoIIGA
LYKVYAELVFLDNFAVNLLIILLAAQLTQARRRWSRFMLAAMLGGIYASVAFGVPSVTILPIRVMTGILMGLVAFWARGERGAWRGVCAFWAASFALAGAVYAVVVAYGETATAGGVIIARPPARAIVLGLLTGVAAVGLLGRIRRRMCRHATLTADIRLKHEGREVGVKAFIDTGNLAREPFTGHSVIFLSQTAAQGLLDLELLAWLTGNGTAKTNRLRFVPCDTASGGGVMTGIEIDSVTMNGMTQTRAVVCLAKRPLPDGCGAIIGGALMDELERGARYEDGNVDTKTGGVGAAATEADRVGGLYRRQRGLTAAALTRGGRHAAKPAEQGRQDSAPRID